MSEQITDTRHNQAAYGVMARYYDIVYAKLAPQDIDFYRELAGGLPGPVLELGCGTGRVSLPLARAGHQVVGLDLSASMLAVFQAKLAEEPPEVRQRVELVHGSMAGFELGRRFGLIIVPFRAFQHLLSVDEQRACLESVARHLLPQGRYVHNLFDPNIDYIVQHKQAGPVWLLDHESVDGERSRTIRRYHMLKPEPAVQTHHLWFKFEEYSLDGELLCTSVEQADMRWQYREEARYLLELCGLNVEAAYGGYDKSPLDERFRELLFVCRAAGPGAQAQ